MPEINEPNGASHNNGTNPIDLSHGISAATGQKRFSTRKLDARIGELEKKIGSIADTTQSAGASGELPRQIADLADQIAKLDERVSKIAHAVAQLNLVR